MENFQDFSADPQADWARLLPRDVFREVVRILRGALPSDGTAKDGGQRDRAMMAAVGALRPGNAEEGQLAAHFVMAEAWAADCLRLAEERRLEINLAMRCRAQALSFLREAKSVRQLLAKVQTERRAMEKDPAAQSRAEWEEHAALGMMAEGLGGEMPAAESPAEAAEPCGSATPVEVPVQTPVQAGGDGRTGVPAADARILRAVSKYAAESREAGFETSMGPMEPVSPPDAWGRIRVERHAHPAPGIYLGGLLSALG